MSRALAKHHSFLVLSAKFLAERARGAVNTDSPPPPRFRDARSGREVPVTNGFGNRATRRAVAKLEAREYCVPFALTVDLCKRLDETAGKFQRPQRKPAPAQYNLRAVAKAIAGFNPDEPVG